MVLLFSYYCFMPTYFAKNIISCINIFFLINGRQDWALNNSLNLRLSGISYLFNLINRITFKTDEQNYLT